MTFFVNTDFDLTNVVSPVHPSGKSIAHTMSLHLSSELLSSPSPSPRPSPNEAAICLKVLGLKQDHFGNLGSTLLTVDLVVLSLRSSNLISEKNFKRELTFF